MLSISSRHVVKMQRLASPPLGRLSANAFGVWVKGPPGFDPRGWFLTAPSLGFWLRNWFSLVTWINHRIWPAMVWIPRKVPINISFFFYAWLNIFMHNACSHLSINACSTSSTYMTLIKHPCNSWRSGQKTSFFN